MNTVKPFIKNCKPVLDMAELGKQRDLREFKASQDYKERPCLQKEEEERKEGKANLHEFK